MNVLFLDFDGVIVVPNTVITHGIHFLNEYEFDNYNPQDINEYQKQFGHLLPSPKRLKLLNKIIKETDANIVISSTWRLYFKIEELKNLLTFFGFNYSDKIIDYTEDLKTARGIEIRNWLRENKNTTNIAILDDDQDMLELMPWLIHTSFAKGLTEELTQQTIDLLSNNEDLSWKHL